MKILNASPTLTQNSITPWKVLPWFSSNLDLVDEYGQVKDNLEEFLAPVPSGYVGINYEWSTGVFEKLKHHVNPIESVNMRLELLNAIYRTRPDLKPILYLCPDPVWGGRATDRGLTKDTIDREHDYLAFSHMLGYCSITGYWKSDTYDEASWDLWVQKQLFVIYLARVIHKKPVLAFVWDRAGGWFKGMPWWAFEKVVKFFYQRDIDIVYWSPWQEGKQYPIKWSTRMTLWKYGLLAKKTSS